MGAPGARRGQAAEDCAGKAYDPADWLPLVDPAGYDPDEHRDRMDHQPVGPPRRRIEASRRQEAWNLFSRARLDWREEHGWTGGLNWFEVMQETERMRRQHL